MSIITRTVLGVLRRLPGVLRRVLGPGSQAVVGVDLILWWGRGGEGGAVAGGRGSWGRTVVSIMAMATTSAGVARDTGTRGARDTSHARGYGGTGSISGGVLAMLGVPGILAVMQLPPSGVSQFSRHGVSQFGARYVRYEWGMGCTTLYPPAWCQ